MLDFNPDKQDFESTGNPLYAWDHIHRAWKQGAPLPEWVMEYLGKAAEQIITMEPRTRQHANMIKNALGFHDCKCFSAYHEQPRDKTGNDIAKMQTIYERVNEERERRPYGEKERIFEKIADEVLEDNQRTSKVSSEYYKYKEAIEEIEKRQK